MTHSIPFHFILFHSIPFHSIPFHSIPSHAIPFQLVPCAYRRGSQDSIRPASVPLVRRGMVTASPVPLRRASWKIAYLEVVEEQCNIKKKRNVCFKDRGDWRTRRTRKKRKNKIKNKKNRKPLLHGWQRRTVRDSGRASGEESLSACRQESQRPRPCWSAADPAW
jgi:hypothetical protein